jgi:DNA-binding GntR family transcriptional regulator
VARSDRTVLVDAVYDALKERIMDQSTTPGVRLGIETLAIELGVSATPVREALARLAAERLVAFEAFKGYTTRPLLTQRQLADLLDVRRLLETKAARLAARTAILADLRGMERELDAMAALSPTPRYRDFRTYVQHDQRFHERLVQAAGNPFLLETFQSLHSHVQLARLVHDLGTFDDRDNAVEHRAIVEAVRARDPDAAAEAVRVHLDRYEAQLGEVLDARPSGASPGAAGGQLATNGGAGNGSGSEGTRLVRSSQPNSPEPVAARSLSSRRKIL